MNRLFLCAISGMQLQQKEAIINELEKKLAEVQELKTKHVLQLTEEYKKKEQSLLESFQRSAVEFLKFYLLQL